MRSSIPSDRVSAAAGVARAARREHQPMSAIVKPSSWVPVVAAELSAVSANTCWPSCRPGAAVRLAVAAVRSARSRGHVDARAVREHRVRRGDDRLAGNRGVEVEHVAARPGPAGRDAARLRHDRARAVDQRPLHGAGARCAGVALRAGSAGCARRADRPDRAPRALQGRACCRRDLRERDRLALELCRPDRLGRQLGRRIRHPAQGDEQGEQRRDVRERQAATDSEEHDLSSVGSEPVSGAEGSYERSLEARSPSIVYLPPEAPS